MGVMNVTPDSFSDGGEYLQPDRASKQASKLIKDGADVLDIGAQSTRPMSINVGADEEVKRLKPALKLIRKNHPEVVISVDTYHSSVADKALELGADWINDISGGRYDPDIFKVCAQKKCPYILTHSRGNSFSMDKLVDYNDVTIDVYTELLKRTDKALDAGIKTDQIIWDPGLGFAKTNEQNIAILKSIELFSTEKLPVLIGPSRKRFIGEVLSQPDPKLRIWGTLAIACRCHMANVAIIRVHDVYEINQILKMAKVIF